MHNTAQRDSRFLKRRKLLTVRKDALLIAQSIRANLTPDRKAALDTLVDEQHPADLVDAMRFLSPEEDTALFHALDTDEAAEVLDEADATTRSYLVRATDPERLADILELLPADEGADVVGGMTQADADHVLSLTDLETAAEIRELLGYPKDTAGGIMATNFVALPETATQAEALTLFRTMREAEPVFYIYTTDAKGILRGYVDLRTLLNAAADTRLSVLQTLDVISVHASCDQEQVASVFARYDLTCLPVVADAPDGRLLGIITADDIIEVIQEENAEDVAHLSGSDAQELEKKTPVQVALLRMPWILTTLFIELLAAFVIKFYDATLTKYILLASFMPIISAISGNTGLQSAAIIIRGLSSGQVQLAHWRHAVTRQVETTLLLGATCAFVLGAIGAVWDRHWSFGLVVFLGMFMSVNIAGVVGTVVPLLSKRAGFDPALTAGPFETAFQDVIGISIFLTLASILLRWLH